MQNLIQSRHRRFINNPVGEKKKRWLAKFSYYYSQVIKTKSSDFLLAYLWTSVLSAKVTACL